MNHEKMREHVHTGIDRQCASLTSDPYRVQRVLNKAHEVPETGGLFVKKKMSVGLIALIALLLLSLTAVAIELLTGMQIIEHFAVPMAQENDSEPYMQENYTHDELAQLIQTLSENGITLDEGSIIQKALASGHGYWEKDTIREICNATFGPDPGAWTLEQKHWYGEMMTAIGAWDININ